MNVGIDPSKVVITKLKVRHVLCALQICAQFAVAYEGRALG